MSARSRAWCFTLNNYDEPDYDIACRYMIIGDEVGESGTPHHQGYIYFDRVKSFIQMKSMLPDGAHIERAKGSPSQNRDYCSKEKIFLERGELPVQGKRTDFERVRDALHSGERMSDIVATATSHQSLRSAEMILRYQETARTWKPEVFWFWGPSGTGKTRTAFEEAPDAWVSGKNLRWWEGYDAHEDVIVDDFRGDFCTYHELLRILDRYEYRVEVKGGSRQLLAKRIFITCPNHPSNVYTTQESIVQLLRRIDHIVHMV